MKVILVDDEYYALQGLRLELEQYKELEIVGLYTKSLEFLEKVEALEPDIVFLDIEMPIMNGFACAERLIEIGKVPQIIFVTAYDQYAIRAFEVNALDYILKPVVPERLQKTINRILGKNEIRKMQEVQFNCFRQFSISIGGIETVLSWRTKKAEELIAFLICEEGAYVLKEKLAEALWPDLDLQKGLSNLYLTHYYVKKMEQKKGLRIPIESKRGRMRICLNSEQCDVFQFNDLIKKAEEKSGKEELDCLESAFLMYKGMLMENQYYPWITVYQQVYELRYMELIQKLVRNCVEAEDGQKLEYYKRRLVETQS